MTDHPYFSKPGQSSGNLAKFWNNGEHCPDAVLVPIEWRYDFARGHAFEAVCRDHATGSKTFFDDFRVSEIDGDVPENIWKTTHEFSGEKLREKLSALEVMTLEKKNKKGEVTEPARRNKTYSAQHAYMDECLASENFGKMPVCQTDYSAMRELAKSICDLDFPKWHRLREYKIGNYLAGCQWQTEHYWDDNGIGKKALADCLYTQHGNAFPADIKWTSSFSQFKSAFQSHHWIQAAHYERGISASLGVKCTPMLFLVGCAGGKNAPNLAQIWSVDKKQRDELDREYDRLCTEYDAWEKAGKPKSGKLEERVQRVWTKKSF